MDVRAYHLFSGSIDHDPSWLEACEDLKSARERMTKRAEKFPGAYFVFCDTTQVVLASIDTSKSKTAMGAPE